MSPQQSIAHYRVTSKLGEGGMGEVWRATDTKLGRDVAIKILPESFATDADRLARFTREAQVLASLNHPNIAAIYGVEDRALVLELVEGEAPAGPLSVEEALPLIHQLIDALEYAHERGIVHRDLKPANLRLTPDRRLKVLDFGLAKALSSDAVAQPDAANSPTLTMRATMAGVIMGTAAYMAPEQARGHAVDKRADIWSFGAVLYELLTGRQLFAGATVSDTLAAVLTRDPDLAGVPPRFHRLLRLCLTRDPRQRLRDISGARLLLDEAPATSKRSTLPWIVAALAVVAAIGVAVWRAPRATTPSLMRLSVDLGREAQADQLSVFALSPDGRRIVYTAHTPDGRRVLATRLFAQGNVELLRGTEGAVDPFFSPDGQWVGFFADTKLKKIPMNGGAVVVLSDVTRAPRGATWGEDGTIVLAATPSEGLARISASGGPLQPLTRPASKGQMTHRWPQFLPGGRKVLMTGHSTTVNFNDAELDVLDVASGQWQTVLRGGFFGRYLPSGHLVYVRDGSLFAVRFDLGTLKTEGVPAPVLDDVGANEVSASGRFSFSSSSALAYMSGKPETVPSKPVWLDAAGKLEPAAQYGALSPDGRLIAYLTLGLGAQNIAVWDTRREVSTAITSDAADNVSPVFAPDGRHLVFGSVAGRTPAIWWARADGAGAPKKLLEGARSMLPFSFSPDGRYLAYGQGTDTGDSDVLVLPIDLKDPENPKPGTPEPFAQTAATEVRPAFSPDGHWIAYCSNEAGGYEIVVRPFHGGTGRWQISAGDGYLAHWSHAGRRLLYATSTGQLMSVDYEVLGDTFVPGKPRRWTDTAVTSNMGRASFELVPDGKRVLATLRPEAPDPNATVHMTLLLNFFDDLKRRLP
jgi:Tol biopolymer transport system component